MKSPERLIREDRPAEGIEAAIAQFRFTSTVTNRRRWPAAAGLATALATGILVARMSVSTAEASPLKRIAEADRNAPRCTMRLYDEKGRMWGLGYQEGAGTRFDYFTSDGLESSRANDGRRTWSVSQRSKTSFIVTDTSRIVAPLETKIADYVGTAKVISTGTASGRKTILVERKASPNSYLQRDTIVVDAQDRPIEVTHRYFKNGRWRTGSREVRDYETPISPKTFAFRPPDDFERYDIDANRWRLLEGVKNGSSRSIKGIKVQLVGALQDRSGMITVVYSGGATPPKDAVSWAKRDERKVVGHALVGIPPDPRAGKPEGKGAFRWPGRIVPSSSVPVVEATAEPYLEFNGSNLRVIRFQLPKITPNRPTKLQVALPAVGEGAIRTVRGVRGWGIGKGIAVFDVMPIASNLGEEIYRHPKVKPAVYEIELSKS